MGLFKLLLTGEDDELNLDRFEHANERSSDVSAQDEFAADQFARTTDLFPAQFSTGEGWVNAEDSQERMREVFARDAAVTRQRDELLLRVGQLHLAVESLLRLLQEKGVITDLDLLRMALQVDRKDGREGGELHSNQPTVNTVNDIPDHCPKCEAKISTGQHRCVLCGHCFDDQSLAMSHTGRAHETKDKISKV